MKNPSKTDVETVHALYCQLTEQEGLPLRFDRQRWRYEWLQCGFTHEDLKTVIRYIKKGIHNGRCNQGSLKFSNLICSVDRFEEDLFEARRVMRVRKPSYVTTTQQVGDIQRQVEVPADSELVDVAKIFEKYWKNKTK